MGKVELRMNELKKYEVIKELVDHGGNKKRASKKLDLSVRQIDRLIHTYKEKGKSGFVHGNRNKKPITALDKQISNDIVLLYTTKYQDFNFKIHVFRVLSYKIKNRTIYKRYDFYSSMERITYKLRTMFSF